MCNSESERRRPPPAAVLLFALFAVLAASIGGLVLRSLKQAGRQGQPPDGGVPVEWSEIRSTVGQDCLIVTSDRATVRSTYARVLLWYEGTPEEADLILTSCGVNSGKHHTIYLNGSPLVQVKDDSYRTCTCNDQPGQSGAAYQSRSTTYNLSNPSSVINGWNYISITNDADIMDTWMAYDLQLVIRGNLTGAVIEEFAFTSSYDGSLRRAVYQLPIGHSPATRAPLLVSIGGTMEDRWDALARFADRANVRGWLLLAPDVRQAEGDSLGRSASLATQHDIIDAIHYVNSLFDVDSDRIYMTGFSTGGGVAATVAAKYPDIFAAVVAWIPPTSLLEWIEQRPDLTWSLTTFDIGCPPQGGDRACPFEWQRRSVRELAMNLKHVPMAIVHGRYDTLVPFAQSVHFYDHMAALYDPIAHNKLAIWHDDGHMDWLPTFEGLDFMANYTLNKNPQDIMVRTDETKDYYWVRISQQAWNGTAVDGFSSVVAGYDWASQAISVSVWDERSLDGGSLPLEVTLDLQAMGLNSHAQYTVEDHPASGESTISYEVLPVEGRLTFTVPRERLGSVQHQYLIYPSSLPRSWTDALGWPRARWGTEVG